MKLYIHHLNEIVYTADTQHGTVMTCTGLCEMRKQSSRENYIYFFLFFRYISHYRAYYHISSTAATVQLHIQLQLKIYNLNKEQD